MRREEATRAASRIYDQGGPCLLSYAEISRKRKDFEVENETWRSVSEINDTVRVKVREWMRKRTAATERAWTQMKKFSILVMTSLTHSGGNSWAVRVELKETIQDIALTISLPLPSSIKSWKRLIQEKVPRPR